MSQLITQLSDRAPAPGMDPWGLIIGQNLWNAAQVGQILLLGVLLYAARAWWVITLSALTLLCLPVSHYLISPGGAVHSALVGITAVGGLWRAPQGIAGMTSARHGVLPFEFVALLCNLGSSLYNYNASKTCFPYWNSIFTVTERTIGLTTPAAEAVLPFFTLGLDTVTVPHYLPLASGSTIGALVFVLLWSVLPTLYVLLFVMLFKNSEGLRGARLQQALCVCGIIHFLFLTDFVDYKLGRGLSNVHSEWMHWTERFAWRIAILLPIYQKVSTGYWKAQGRFGAALHYVIGGWAIFFFVYQVLGYDLPRFFHFATRTPPSALLNALNDAYVHELGYHGALVLMVALYALLLWRRRSAV